MEIFDGVKNPFIFGKERIEILNRSMFCLNLFTRPTDELSIRYFIAGANDSVIITEPGLNNYPFANEKHLIVSNPHNVPSVISSYVNDMEAWRDISNNMFQLITKKYTLEFFIGQIMKKLITY